MHCFLSQRHSTVFKRIPYRVLMRKSDGEEPTEGRLFQSISLISLQLSGDPIRISKDDNEMRKEKLTSETKTNIEELCEGKVRKGKEI